MRHITITAALYKRLLMISPAGQTQTVPRVLKWAHKTRSHSSVRWHTWYVVTESNKYSEHPWYEKASTQSRGPLGVVR